MHPVLQRLDRYRLDQDLSFQQLADQLGMKKRTVYGLLRGSVSRPFDRTIHKINEFLDERRAPAESGRRSA